MTLESWSMGIARPVMEQFPHAWILFIVFILVATFTMLNLFIAIIVNAMQSFTDDERSRGQSGREPRARPHRSGAACRVPRPACRNARLEGRDRAAAQRWRQPRLTLQAAQSLGLSRAARSFKARSRFWRWPPCALQHFALSQRVLDQQFVCRQSAHGCSEHALDFGIVGNFIVRHRVLHLNRPPF
jgi:hypothetical protein